MKKTFLMLIISTLALPAFCYGNVLEQPEGDTRPAWRYCASNADTQAFELTEAITLETVDLRFHYCDQFACDTPGTLSAIMGLKVFAITDLTNPYTTATGTYLAFATTTVASSTTQDYRFTFPDVSLPAGKYSLYTYRTTGDCSTEYLQIYGASSTSALVGWDNERTGVVEENDIYYVINYAGPELDYTTLTDYFAVHYETPPENTTYNVATSTASSSIDLTAQFTRSVDYRLADIYAILQNSNNASNTAYVFSADQTGTSSVQYTGYFLFTGLPAGSYYVQFIYRFEAIDSTSTYWYVVDMLDNYGNYKWVFNVPTSAGTYVPGTIIVPEDASNTTTSLGWFGNEIVNVLKWVFVPSFTPYTGLLTNITTQLQTKFPFAYFYQIYDKYETIIADNEDSTTTYVATSSVVVFSNPITITWLDFTWLDNDLTDQRDDIRTWLTWALWLSFVGWLWYTIITFKPSE